jgi:hypothetical protein
MASLASQFDSSRRRDNLTWCHHAAVASLRSEEQEIWLDRAIALRLSVADLRIELKSARRGAERVADSVLDQPGAAVEPDRISCPNCGYLVPVSISPQAVQLRASNDVF